MKGMLVGQIQNEALFTWACVLEFIINHAQDLIINLILTPHMSLFRHRSQKIVNLNALLSQYENLQFKRFNINVNISALSFTGLF